MSITKEEILNAVAEMSVMDVIELTSMMEKKFGVSATTAVTAAVSDPVAVVEEQTEFNVVLSSVGSNKISIIKAVRSITGLGLKEAKDLVESESPILKEGVSRDDANIIKKTLEEAGASIEIR